MPTLKKLKHWVAPTASENQMQKLVAHLTPMLPAQDSPLRTEQLRSRRGDGLRILGQLLKAQLPLIRREIWLTSAFVLVLGWLVSVVISSAMALTPTALSKLERGAQLMIRWRYYLKMLRYEQFLIPLTLLPLFVAATLLVRDPQDADSIATETGRMFIEAVLPLVSALIGSSMVLTDPLLELHYTLPRPLWRTQLERLGLLVVFLAGLYGVFVSLTWFLGVPWIGWSSWPTGGLGWLGLTLFWLGLALFSSAGLHSATAGGGLVALIWLSTTFMQNSFLSSFWSRLIMPQLAIFDPNNADWPLNRLILIGLGLVTTGVAAFWMRRGEYYINSEK